MCFSCQFVVNDEQDYKAHFTDPDTLVNWDCVQQVVSASGHLEALAQHKAALKQKLCL